jgi:hypothetical protein
MGGLVAAGRITATSETDTDTDGFGNPGTAQY